MNWTATRNFDIEGTIIGLPDIFVSRMTPTQGDETKGAAEMLKPEILSSPDFAAEARRSMVPTIGLPDYFLRRG